jgi:hypothetical protein
VAVQLVTLPLVTIAAGGTAERLSSSGIAVTAVTIQASLDNTGSIYVGDSTVDADTGIVVAPGDACTVEAPVGRHGPEEIVLNEIYVVSSTTGDSCRVAAFRRRP